MARVVEALCSEHVDDRAALKTKWEEAFGSPPPLYASVSFMRKALAYQRQVRQFGGLNAITRRALASELASGRRQGRGSKPTPGHAPSAATGAMIVREWNGRTYRVQVLDDGYEFDGRHWTSLSSIARRITGTNWSGPRFFGLTAKRTA